MRTKANRRSLFLALGPVLFILLILFLPESLFPTAASRSALATVVWMAFWWVTSSIDYAVTAFLPIALNSVLRMADMSSVIANYASETILLLLGASILVVSWEITGLDRRIAVKCLSMVGGRLSSQIVFWFLLSAALSAVLPNAVVCATITPIAVSMLKFIGEEDIGNSKNGSLILLTIAYATGVGGLASPLGGAMNLVAVDYLQQVTGQEYMYLSWVVRFLPIMAILLISNILYLLRHCKKGETLAGSREYFANLSREMQPMGRDEKWALALFVIATALSFCRQFYQTMLPGLKPAYVFIICAIISFTIRKSDGARLMRWKQVHGRIIWDLIFIFAGGLAAGTLINSSGCAADIGAMVSNANLSGGFMTILVIVILTVLLSDVTSNTATAAVALPIVISIADAIGADPVPYIYIASIGVNLSYMLPTSIRAIPVGYGLKPGYMLKEGVPLTVIVIILMSVTAWVLYRFWPMFSTI